MSSATSTRQGFNIFLGAGLALALGAIGLLRGQNPASVSIVALTLLAAGLTGVALIRVLAPFASGDAHGASPLIGGRRRAALERDKLLTLRSIKELEFDRAMGKVSDVDFAEMAGRLRSKAAGLIQRLDAGSTYREQIDRELARRVVSAPPALAAGVCGGCGTANDADARFCKQCGQGLARA